MGIQRLKQKNGTVVSYRLRQRFVDNVNEENNASRFRKTWGRRDDFTS